MHYSMQFRAPGVTVARPPSPYFIATSSADITTFPIASHIPDLLWLKHLERTCVKTSAAPPFYVWLTFDWLSAVAKCSCGLGPEHRATLQSHYSAGHRCSVRCSGRPSSPVSPVREERRQPGASAHQSGKRPKGDPLSPHAALLSSAPSALEETRSPSHTALLSSASGE
jgi:hypothetical protein